MERLDSTIEREQGELFGPVWEPQGFDKAALDRDQRIVYRMLTGHGVGLANAIKQRDLALMCWPDKARPDTRYLQIVLKELTEEHGVAIGTSCREPMGVYLIECREELDLYTKNLFARALSGLRRYSTLKKVHGDELAGQIRLAMGER